MRDLILPFLTGHLSVEGWQKERQYFESYLPKQVSSFWQWLLRVVYSVSFSAGWDLLEFPRLQVHPVCMDGEREKGREEKEKKRREKGRRGERREEREVNRKRKKGEKRGKERKGIILNINWIIVLTSSSFPLNNNKKTELVSIMKKRNFILSSKLVQRDWQVYIFSSTYHICLILELKLVKINDTKKQNKRTSKQTKHTDGNK